MLNLQSGTILFTFVCGEERINNYCWLMRRYDLNDRTSELDIRPRLDVVVVIKAN